MSTVVRRQKIIDFCHKHGGKFIKAKTRRRIDGLGQAVGRLSSYSLYDPIELFIETCFNNNPMQPTNNLWHDYHIVAPDPVYPGYSVLFDTIEILNPQPTKLSELIDLGIIAPRKIIIQIIAAKLRIANKNLKWPTYEEALLELENAALSKEWNYWVKSLKYTASRWPHYCLEADIITMLYSENKKVIKKTNNHFDYDIYFNEILDLIRP